MSEYPYRPPSGLPLEDVRPTKMRRLVIRLAVGATLLALAAVVILILLGRLP
jgi:hypothetical protein